MHRVDSIHNVLTIMPSSGVMYKHEKEVLYMEGDNGWSQHARYKDPTADYTNKGREGRGEGGEGARVRYPDDSHSTVERSEGIARGELITFQEGSQSQLPATNVFQA